MRDMGRFLQNFGEKTVKMIYFDKNRNTFYLEGKSFSYVFSVEEGYLHARHFGGRVGRDGLTWLNGAPAMAFSAMPPAGEGSTSLDVMPQEYASFGQGDYRTPSVLLEREDGQTASRFFYLSHEVGCTSDFGALPHARGGQTLKVTLKDVLSDVELDLFYTVWEDCDVLTRHAVIRNTGSEPVTICRAYSFCLDLPADRYETLCLHGHHCGERSPERTPLSHGTFRIESARGASSHQMNPFLALLRAGCGEETGECYGVELVYSGSFVLSAERSQTEGVRVQGGINALNFCWSLAAGEDFVTPEAALCYSKEGLGGLSRSLADFLRLHVISPKWAFAPRPVVLNSWEAVYFDFDEAKLLSLIDGAARTGADTFVLDDGWFGCRGDDTTSLGDWRVNLSKLKGGIAPLAARCRKHNMKFGLWFEPEMVSEKSELYRAHPDWAIGAPPRCACRNQYVLDFSRPEVVEYVYGQLAEILKTGDVAYVKWDMNRHLTEFWSKGLPAGRQGELAHRHILGVYTLARRLTEDFPEVLFEGCSGGGGRFDAGMLYYFPQIWTSDNTDAYARAKIQYGTSFAYPMSAMSCHISASPNHQTGRSTPFSSRAHIASLGATGFELNPAALSEEELEMAREHVRTYREMQPLVLQGDLYRLASPFEGDFAVLLLSKDKREGYLVGMCGLVEAGAYDRRLRLAGLREDFVYEIPALGIVARGDTLLHAGVLLPRLPDFGTFAWRIHGK